MGLPTGVEGKERGDESAEETDQKPVAVAVPPVVEIICTPNAASPSEQTEVNMTYYALRCFISKCYVSTSIYTF